jgi:hypothetical protein
VKSGEPDTGVVMPLGMMMVEKFEGDAHFVCYTTPQSMRLRKDMTEPMKFDFVAYDADFNDHKSRPASDDFFKFVDEMFIHHYAGVPLPNVIYQTRGGCRLVFLIRPLFDANIFESHVKALARKLSKAITNSRDRGVHRYELDTGALDWTRMFRCPHVVRDGKPEYDYQVRLFHTGLLDLLRFKPTKKKEYVIRATGKPITDEEQRRSLVELTCRLKPGCRNDEWHKWAYKQWKQHPDDAEALFPSAAEICLESGLDLKETLSAWKSAERAAKAAG